MTKELELPKPESTSNVLDFAILLLAILSLSIAGICIRLSEVEISPIATGFHRLWIATLAFGLWSKINSQPSKEYKETYTLERVVLLIAAAGIASVGLLLWNWSLTQTSVANATVLRNFNVLFTPLAGWLVFGQRYDKKFLVGMLLAIIGVISIGWSDFQIANQNIQGDLAALLSALAISIFFLIVEELRTQLNATTIMIWRCGVGCILFLPLFLLSGDKLFPYSPIGWLAVVAQAIICQMLGQGLLVYVIKRLSSGFISLVVPLEVFFAAITAWIMFSEQISLSNFLAFALILLGVYIAKSSNSTIKLSATDDANYE